MPLPPTRVVTGTYTNPLTGDPVLGRIILTPEPQVWTDSSGEQVLAGGGTVALVDGEFSEALVTTDAAGVEPAEGKLWRIEERLDGLPTRIRYFLLPYGAGTPIDITAIVAADPGSVEYTPVEGPQPDLGAAGAGDDIALRSTDPTTTNARTPTAHAASHAAAGSDPVTLTQAQITGLAAALAALAPLAGATFTGAVVVDDANFSVLGVNKGYRFRPLGARLDCEATGSDWMFSVFSGTAFDGSQRTYLRLESGVQLAHACGRWQFSDTPDSAAVHVLDGSANTLGFHGSGPVAQQAVTGSRGGNAALASLLTALDTLGLIDNQTTA